MKVCPRCGFHIYGSATRCLRCGAVIKKKRKKRTALIAVLAAFLFVCIIGVFLLFIRKPGQSSNKSDQSASGPSESGQNTDPRDPAEKAEKQQEASQDTEPDVQHEEQKKDTDKKDADKEDTGKGDTDEAKADSSGKVKGAAAEYDSYLYYFRAMLEGDELALYDGLYDISRVDAEASEKELYVSVFPGSDKFSDMFAKARSFMSADHPELFYIRGFRYQYWDDPNEDGNYRVILSFDGFMPSDYEQEVEEMESAADALLSQVDTSQHPAKIALEIHDRIMDLVEYDYETYENGPDFDLAYSAYGALVENSSGHRNMAVCSGYAEAYEYLLQKAGILCLVISGNTWSESDQGGSHAWNLVELDGEWYETDCTWDDNVHDGHGDEEEGILAEAISDDYYRNTIEHYLFQVTTEQIEDFDPGDDYTYESVNGWATFLGKCGRTRNNWDNVDETYDYSTVYAPVAEGTKYSYDNIR